MTKTSLCENKKDSNELCCYNIQMSYVYKTEHMFLPDPRVKFSDMTRQVHRYTGTMASNVSLQGV